MPFIPLTLATASYKLHQTLFSIVSLSAVGLLLGTFNPAHAAPTGSCEGQPLHTTFASGARWDLCWTIRELEGLTLSAVHYQAPQGVSRRILSEASLSQIEASFDDNAIEPAYVVTQFGLGGENLRTLTVDDCPEGSLHHFAGLNAVCTRRVGTGYLYRYTAQRQTERFDISAISQIGPRSYILRWSLHENGMLEPAIGLSGMLSALDQSTAPFGWPIRRNGLIATSFLDHYSWRLDFDLDSTPNNDVVEEIISTPSADRLRKSMAISRVIAETGRRLDPELKRFWRVRDADTRNGGLGFISYELVTDHYDQSRANPYNRPWLDQDVWFTNYRACERHAAGNPSTGGCGTHVSEFANGESLTGGDIVLWYKISNHILPRSEDSNRIGIRWSSFQLLPRDWSRQQPFNGS